MVPLAPIVNLLFVDFIDYIINLNNQLVNSFQNCEFEIMIIYKWRYFMNLF